MVALVGQLVLGREEKGEGGEVGKRGGLLFLLGGGKGKGREEGR